MTCAGIKSHCTATREVQPKLGSLPFDEPRRFTYIHWRSISATCPDRLYTKQGRVAMLSAKSPQGRTRAVGSPFHPRQLQQSLGFSSPQGVKRLVNGGHQKQRECIECNAQGQGLPPELKQSIDDFVQENTIVVFMKGTKEIPQCGFSNTVVQILNQLNAPYVTVNILENDMLRNGMKEYSLWPTFPQVYIGGEFFGGCDIMIESYQSGELQEVLEIALLSN